MTADRWVLFDLNGTLLNPRPIGSTLPTQQGDEIVAAALHDAVVQAMVDSLSGASRPFAELLHNGLLLQVRRAGIEVEPGQLAALADEMTTMPAFPDATAAVALLRRAGLRTGALSNSATDRAIRALDRAGLLRLMDKVLGADQVGVYKPATALYRAASERLAVAPSAITLVSAHWWDLTGASRAGLKTAWVGRDAEILLAGTPTPDHQAVTLLDVAEQIVQSS
jgi:2-haloacid dehalogenase